MGQQTIFEVSAKRFQNTASEIQHAVNYESEVQGDGGGSSHRRSGIYRAVPRDPGARGPMTTGQYQSLT